MARIRKADIITIMSTKQESLLSLLHLSSPALPVGAFAYSQGLEYALDIGWLKKADDVQAWIEQGLTTGFGQLDLPVYMRVYDAWKQSDYKSVQYWNDTLLAFRETKELYLEDTQVGSAYQQWHLGIDAERQTQLDEVTQPTVVTMNSLAAIYDDIAIDDALLGFTWAWCENQIACASKAMPMGQTQGQQILKALIPPMVQVCEKAQSIKDDEIGTGLFSLAMASSLHEHQYSRLFRS
ncbi:urease accessory protein UreF [Bermanella marisrubri]|uniref:urease accessory protein UreF n=1 Tax=Bermanella marisrubri TaxID=207949 RepID=UPI001B306902|nr:urease accessory UreF family protein [Bermanella marisrubri]